MPENSTISAESLRDGRYVVTGSLGAGSQGETLEAVDKREGRAVAIKRFQIRGAKSWKDVELAEREATVLASLSHSALPRYVEHFEENGALYLVMEKIEGETLAARRKRGAPLNQQQVLRFLREVSKCLRYLHGQAPPIVHRDIKPGNVILRPDGSYCLVDFGSVRDRLKPEGGSTVVGTFGFMAPEQFQGRAAPVSDVYAVGATALSLLTGSEPEDLPHKGLAIDVEQALRGQVERRLIGALLSMLEPDPDRRVGSIDAALKQYDSGAEPSRESAPAQAVKQARKARLEAEAVGRQARLEAEAWGRDQSEGAWQHQSRRERQREGEEQRRDKRDARRREKADRQAHRRTRDAQRLQRPGRPVPPGIFIGFLILLALRVAMFGTFALFQVLLPILFTLLSVVGGRRTYQRGRHMLEIGRAGQRGLERAYQHVRYQFLGGPEPSELAESDEPFPFQSEQRARVADAASPVKPTEADAEAEEAELDATSNQARR